jgi:hypothetical protein
MNKKEIFNKLFDNGITYEEYFKQSEKHKKIMTENLLASKKSIQMLNDNQIAQMNEKLRVLCIAENWCIDCANGVPIIGMLAALFSNWDFRIISRDSYRKEFAQFYATIGRNKIPVILFADEDGDEIIRWVERPTQSYQLLSMLKNQDLPKEEFIKKYHDMEEFKPPVVAEKILTELVLTATKAAAIVQANPPHRK